MTPIRLYDAKAMLKHTLLTIPKLEDKYDVANPPRLRPLEEVEMVFATPEIMAIEHSQDVLAYLRWFHDKEMKEVGMRDYDGSVAYNYIVNMSIVILLFKAMEMGADMSGESPELNIDTMYDGLVGGLFKYYHLLSKTDDDPKAVAGGRWVMLPNPFYGDMALMFPEASMLADIVDEFNGSVEREKSNYLSVLIPVLVTTLVLNFPLLDMMESSLADRFKGIKFNLSNFYGCEKLSS